MKDLEIVDLGMKITKRLARYILALCKVMTIKEVVKDVELDCKCVKDIHKASIVFDQFNAIKAFGKSEEC